MTAVTITLDDAQVSLALQALLDVTGHLEPALDAIGLYIESSILQNFRDQHEPDGTPWQELSETTLENRRQDGVGAEILRDTGRLNNSITHNVDDDFVEVGTNVVYANMMHFGGKKADFPWLWGDIPARPFVGTSDDDNEEIAMILRRFIVGSSGAY